MRSHIRNWWPRGTPNSAWASRMPVWRIVSATRSGSWQPSTVEKKLSPARQLGGEGEVGVVHPLPAGEHHFGDTGPVDELLGNRGGERGRIAGHDERYRFRGAVPAGAATTTGRSAWTVLTDMDFP
ncbi:hypothetical protein NQP46_00665 [Streptomyces albus]|nr:hypothetical protein NQP46_00665 [Streptomyces albus]